VGTSRESILDIVPSDSDPEVRAHFRFDWIIRSNAANNAAGETSPFRGAAISSARRGTPLLLLKLGA